jgi:hypothetical protein
MLLPEMDGVKYSVVFLVNAKDVQYQFISFNNTVILVIFESASMFNKVCLDSGDQMFEREYK